MNDSGEPDRIVPAAWQHTVPDLPTTMYDFLLTLQQKSPHGGPFEYRSCETDVLGWICERQPACRCRN